MLVDTRERADDCSVRNAPTAPAQEHRPGAKCRPSPALDPGSQAKAPVGGAAEIQVRGGAGVQAE